MWSEIAPPITVPYFELPNSDFVQENERFTLGNADLETKLEELGVERTKCYEDINHLHAELAFLKGGCTYSNQPHADSLYKCW